MDVSLYQLALDTKPSPQPLSVSPATLKSLVGGLVDVLIEQQLPATLWVKLPPGEIWQAEIDRYRQQVELPHTIYLCKTDQTQIGSPLSKSTDISRIFPIQLAPGSQLRREYFLLVLSAQFCGVILTHRPRPFKTVPETNLNTKPQLLTIYSFVRQTVQRVLDGIKKAMPTAVIPPDASAQLGISGGVEELIARWDSLFALPQKPDPLILNQLLLKQLQRQEEMWHQVRLNKRLADSPISGAIAENLLLTQLSGGKDAATSATDILKSSVGIKDEFLNHMVQELRMPLTNMKTALTLLESATLKPAQRQRYMHLLHTECDRQSSLIAGLLDLLQLENATSSVMQPLYLADIVPGIVSTYQPLAQEKGIQLGYTVPDKLPAVYCLETWLRQIAINLLHNSIKYTPKGGQVSVLANLQGDYVQLEFRDTGNGIAPSDIPKIFERFYRGRHLPSDDVSGAGLGLTIVQQLLLRCGGSISVTSRLGEGSIFKVLLPVAHT